MAEQAGVRAPLLTSILLATAPAPTGDGASPKAHPVPALDGGLAAPGAWLVWRDRKVQVCWTAPCGRWETIWPDARLDGCPPDRAAFVDRDSVVLVCPRDEAFVVHRGQTAQDLDTPPYGIPIRRPTRSACNAAGLRPALDRTTATLTWTRCAPVPARGEVTCVRTISPVVSLEGRRPPKLAGLSGAAFVEATTFVSAARGGPVGAPVIDTPRRRAWFFWIGLEVGWVPGRRLAWERERLTLWTRARTHASRQDLSERCNVTSTPVSRSAS